MASTTPEEEDNSPTSEEESSGTSGEEEEEEESVAESSEQEVQNLPDPVESEFTVLASIEFPPPPFIPSFRSTDILNRKNSPQNLPAPFTTPQDLNQAPIYDLIDIVLRYPYHLNTRNSPPYYTEEIIDQTQLTVKQIKEAFRLVKEDLQNDPNWAELFALIGFDPYLSQPTFYQQYTRALYQLYSADRDLILC